MEPIHLDAAHITSSCCVFNASAHNIVDLSQVIARHPEEDVLSQLSKEFESRGWVIVELPHIEDATHSRSRYGGKYNLVAPRSELLSQLSQFFEAPLEQKQEYTESSTLGYSHVDHKEGLHLLTGHHAVGYRRWDLNKKDHPNDPLNIRPAISSFLEDLDDLVLDFMRATAVGVFGCTKRPENDNSDPDLYYMPHATLVHRADLPVAYGGGQLGMLDIAHYFNKQSVADPPPIGHSTAEVNCVPHFDPGLFSLSFLSTQEGLQLFDPVSQQWFAGPVNTRAGEENLGVIWLGDAAVRASKGKLKAGIHRVIYPTSDTTSRITAWYEVCTVDQVNQDLNPQPIATDGVVDLPNLPNAKPLKVRNGEDAAVEITRRYGIPMSKIMRKSDDFSAGYSEDYQRLSAEEQMQLRAGEAKKVG